MTNTIIPSPYSFSPSQSFTGSDGSWSSFVIRVGNPAQNFKVLPSTNGQESWVPLPEGCRSIDPSNCGELRGAYADANHNFGENATFGFNINGSTTWKDMGIYELDLEDRLGYTGNGKYGLDTVGLQVQNSGGLTLDNQVVAGFVTRKFMMGVFPLGPKPTNFTGFDFPQPSFMKSLWDAKKIPSLSWGYTAGAAYKTPQVSGSLTLGGYDSSRFESPKTKVSFPFNQDDSKFLTVGIQRIDASTSLSGATVSPMLTSITALIDSTVPQIWLPQSVCDAFESLFGLHYDNKTDLYLVNDTIHSKLQQLNPTFTFALGNNADPSRIVNIALPYAAFDLQASWPIYNNTQNYFPIRRAANDSQFTLGRAFLQEAYVIADYERSNFLVHQANFSEMMPPQQIVSILSPTLENAANATGNLSQTSPHRLSTPAIAGITVGASIGSLLLFLLCFFYSRRRMAREAAKRPPPPPKDPNRSQWPREKHEMFTEFGEVIGSKINYELDSKNLYLISDDHGHEKLVHEMPANTWRNSKRSGSHTSIRIALDRANDIKPPERTSQRQSVSRTWI